MHLPAKTARNSHGKTTEKRARLANAKLIDAFWACLEDHRLADITISAITKSAELNRGTFYYHFRDIDDLTARAIEVEFNSQALLPGIFDLIAGAPGSITAIELVQQRMQRLSLLIDRGGLDVLSMQIKRLVRQTWTAILCAEGESLKPETLFIIEYTTSGTIGLIANEAMRASAQTSPDALNGFLARNSAFLLEQIGNAQGVPRNIILERIHATRRVSRLNAKR